MPHFSSGKYLQGLWTEGWILLCGVGVVYEPQLARDSSPCGVVSTQEKSGLVLGLLELIGYGMISRAGWSPILTRCVGTPPPPQLAGLYPPRVSLALRVAQRINDKPM